MDITITPELRDVLTDAEEAVERGFYPRYQSAVIAVLRARKDPTGPDGIYGLGRCARCGESFKLKDGDGRAEVALGVVHVECVGGDELA